VSDPRQHQEQPQLRQPTVTQRRAGPQRFRHPLDHEEQAKDRSRLRSERKIGGLVELAAQQSPHGREARGGPVREVGEGTILDLAVLPKGFGQGKGGQRVAVGDGDDIHDFLLS